MRKTECFCMQRLSRTNGKTILNKLLVFCKRGSTDYLISTIGFVVEQRQSN